MLEFIIKKSIKQKIQTPQDLARIKREGAFRFGKIMPTNIQLLKVYHKLLKKGKIKKYPALEKLLKTRGIRTSSGVAIITVLTKPWPCPGQCLYCPNEAGMPKSYLKNEPAAQRAFLTKFNPYLQVKTRLQALEMTGHSTDKIELIVLGGTWSAYPKNYQYWFIKECFRAGNDTNSKIKNQKSKLQFKIQNLRRKLKTEQHKNETARHRIVGLTLETRPDYITIDEIKKMRDLGCTRVELGVQSIYDDVLKKNLRGHDVAATIYATRLLKNAGFKINYHMMLNLPGSTTKRDERMFIELFSDGRFQPDLLKIYPCSVLRTAPLYKIWKHGGFKPYSEKQLINLILRIKQKIPSYVRIQRIIRDIPGASIVAGSRLTNLRQIIHQLKGVRYPSKRYLTPFCRCIRCREIRGSYLPTDKIKLFRRDYKASDGKEIFLSFEDKKQEKLYALLRLRIPQKYNKIPPNLPLLKGGELPPFVREGWGGFKKSLPTLISNSIPVLKDAALIRELHTYGHLVPLSPERGSPAGEPSRRVNYAAQHTGLGKKLMSAAEKIAQKEFGFKKIAVISGIGVRQYYKNLGYKLENEYMIKKL